MSPFVINPALEKILCSSVVPKFISEFFNLLANNNNNYINYFNYTSFVD